MTLLEVAKHALEAMEDAMYRADTHEFYEAKEALRAALAEPEREPVAWMQEMPISGNEERSVRMTTVKMVADEWDNPIPLYTAPTPRKPVELTDEELEKAFNANGWSNHICGLRDVIAAYKAKQRGKE